MRAEWFSLDFVLHDFRRLLANLTLEERITLGFSPFVTLMNIAGDRWRVKTFYSLMGSINDGKTGAKMIWFAKATISRFRNRTPISVARGQDCLYSTCHWLINSGGACRLFNYVMDEWGV